MSLIKKNIAANYIGKLWGFASVYLFIPAYIRLLGIESYAVMSFYSVILAIMYIADAGLSATFSREAARSVDNNYLGSLLCTIERLYVLICILIAFVIIFFSPLIAHTWLKSGTIPETKLAHYISLMGICVSLQLYTTLFNGGLMGLQRQVLANTLQIIYSVFRSGVVLIPIFFYPNLYVYFIWQILINLLILFLTRYNLWKSLRSSVSPVFNLTLLRGIWKFALGMMMMSLISALNTQIDKLLTSKYLALADYGYYSLASTIAQAPAIITMPIAIAISPHLTRLVQDGNKKELISVYHKYSFLICVLSVSVTLVLLFYTKDFVHIWTGDDQIAASIDKVTKVLVIGGMFLSLQFMPYYLAIANGHNATNVKLGIGCLFFIIPVLVIIIPRFGLIGAGMSWLITNIFAFVVLGFILTRKFLPGQVGLWFLKDSFRPIVLSGLISAILFIPTLYMSHGYWVIVYSAMIFIFSFIGSLLFRNDLRSHIWALGRCNKEKIDAL